MREESGPIANDVLANYSLANFADSPNPARAAWGRINGDYGLVCETHDAALRAAAAAKLPVWSYNFNVPVDDPDLGATHGAEIYHVFGLGVMTSPEAIAATALIQTAWTTFAATGDPNSAAVDWPSFTQETDLKINFELSGPSTVANFRARECAFWRSVYDLAFAALATTR